MVSEARAQHIIESVARRHNIDAKSLKMPCRHAYVYAARRAAWVALHDAGMAYAAIGRFTNHHHSSVMHGIKRARRGEPVYYSGVRE